jgi:hypothetical protein
MPPESLPAGRRAWRPRLPARVRCPQVRPGAAGRTGDGPAGRTSGQSRTARRDALTRLGGRSGAQPRRRVGTAASSSGRGGASA